jgi:anti-sigma regulatory factor (Ser/Thr protein kinase)
LEEPESKGYLMDTMCVDSTTIRSATAVADARETTRAFLEALRQPAVDSEAADTVILVVSELVTNALRHGGGTYTLHLTAHPDLIEVAVDDPSSQAPRVRTPDLNGGTGGFGWPMVNRLAHATAVTRRPSGGKTVSALLTR